MYRLLSILLVISFSAHSQQDSTRSNFVWSAYAETYYSHNFNQPPTEQKLPFLYSYNRYQQLSLNLLMGRVSYQSKAFRSSLALAAGTYMDDNLEAEDAVWGQVFEASLGVKLSKNKQLWLDAGVFPSHIGFESAIGSDQFTLTRSMMADNSPYYESGFKLSYTSSDERWFLAVLCVNGWQKSIRFGQGFNPAFGHQITYKPTGSLTLNSSSFIGDDRYTSVKRSRYFHNLYASWKINDRWSLIGGFDIGWEEKRNDPSKMHSWYTPVAIVGFSISDRHRVAGRVEYYRDVNGVIIDYPLPTGFQTAGYSFNYDFLMSKSSCFRIEARKFSSAQPIFISSNGIVSNNTFLTTSLCIRF